ncbi:nucleolar and coiled-body phosphoprotein 1 [Patella vulgata]|uniref:nucleolar and coiled-body phosphoprotein 1 n=1 Tax=Patella vulgata TaxID=6465 RepID=UPI00217F9AD9|nr:nucleolar and coiled-body phosphoprotein 1 [Patella vulgata]
MRYLRNIAAAQRGSPSPSQNLPKGPNREYRLEQRLNLIDAFIKRNFRTELYLSKAISTQSAKPMWKAIEADMTFQEHLVNLEEKRLLWKQWNRGNQTEGKPCSDIPLPHVCICDQTIVPRKKKKPKSKKVFGRNAKPIPPPVVPREPEICCERCCKNTPTPKPTPTATPEPDTVNSRLVNSHSPDKPNRSASSSKYSSVTHLGKGESSSLTSVEKYEDGSTIGQNTNVFIESRPASKHTNVNVVSSKNDAKASENTKSTCSLNSSKTIGNKSQVTSTVFSEGPREEASVIERASASTILSDGIKEGGVSRMSRNAPPGYNTESLIGLFSLDASVNTDISYFRKPEQLNNSKLKPSTPAFNLKTDPKIREMMHTYKKANKSTKTQLTKKKSELEKETGKALENSDDQTLEKLDEQDQGTVSNEESAGPSNNPTAHIRTVDKEKPSVKQPTTDTESSEENELNTENNPEHTPDQTAENEEEGNKREESSMEKAETPVKNNSKTCKLS